MVLTSTFPPDSRVEKEAISLSEDGHEVHILCYSEKKLSNTERYQHYTVHRRQFSMLYKNKLSALALIFPFFFLKWRKEIDKLNKTFDFHVIHIHDLPLSKVGYYFKKKYNKKLVCDQHEFYSNWIKDTAHMNTFFGKIVSRFSNWTKYEKKYLGLADLIITVAKPLELNYINIYNIDKEKIITIPNTPTKKIYNVQNVKTSIVEKYKDYFTIFYAGGIDILRGIDTAIIALKEVKNKIPNVKLLLGGKIIKPYDPFKTAKAHGVYDLIEFKGWIDEKDLPSYMAASKICFFTPPATRDEINKTIATKIYQYAIMNKPIVTSNASLMKDFVEKNNLGIAIKNSKEFSLAILDIYNKNITNNNEEQNKSWYWENTVKPLIAKYGGFKP